MVAYSRGTSDNDRYSETAIAPACERSRRSRFLAHETRCERFTIYGSHRESAPNRLLV